MNDTDTVLVRPLSTYFDYGEHRNAGGEPYRVTRSHGLELKGLGTAEVLDDDALETGPGERLAAETEATIERAAAASEVDEPPKDEDDKPRGRRGTVKD